MFFYHRQAKSYYFTDSISGPLFHSKPHPFLLFLWYFLDVDVFLRYTDYWQDSSADGERLN